MKRKSIVCLGYMFFFIVSVFCLEPGDKAPSFANPDPEGNYHFSKNYFTEGWVLLDFFATWCEPCKEKLPKVIALDSEYALKGLTTIIFAIDKEGPEIVGPYFEENPINAIVLIDRYQVTIRDKYGETSIPLYFLVDETGTIRYKGTDIDEIHDILEEHLKS